MRVENKKNGRSGELALPGPCEGELSTHTTQMRTVSISIPFFGDFASDSICLIVIMIRVEPDAPCGFFVFKKQKGERNHE